MKCENPRAYKHTKGVPFPCGNCLPCLITRRRVWTQRIVSEASLWPSNAFVTLTYDDDHLPDFGVSTSEHQSFMKNLRTQWHDATGCFFRFYMCGEYGEKTFRPHYHYALFNFPTCCGRGPTWRGKRFIPCTCNVCMFVSRVWGKGHVFIGNLEHNSAQYVAGYVTKKLTKKDDPRLKFELFDPSTGEIKIVSYNPEFSLMSRNPGLGAGAVDGIIKRWQESGLESLPNGIRVRDRFLPLGRYMKGKMNDILQETPLSLNQIEARQMLSLLRDIKGDPTLRSFALKYGSGEAVQKIFGQQKVLQVNQSFTRKGNI